MAIAFAGLLFAFSQTSFLALFAGLVVLVALRWSFRWTAIAALARCGGGRSGTSSIRSSSSSSDSLNTEGHGTLVSGGLKLARHRPLYGYGSASFSKEFAREENVPPGDTTISHSEPVTVAAEQGAIGVIAYLGLLAAALWTLLAGMRRMAPGLGAPFRSLAEGDRVELTPGPNRDRRGLLRAARPHDRLRGLPHRSAHLGAARRRRRARGRGGSW